mmetsp:Transcript_5881/g.8793  ORF Transcript_5881/g.8793 Transcript_5881/m.8793 type:complete len:95 (+) Transcript_5881:206-490(+)
MFLSSQCDLANSKFVVAKQPSLSHWRSLPPMDPVQQLTLTGEVCSDARHISTCTSLCTVLMHPSATLITFSESEGVEKLVSGDENRLGALVGLC